MTRISEVKKLLQPLANTTKPRSSTKNAGKIRKDLVSFNFLADAYYSICELEDSFKYDRKISVDLLVRYIFELEIDFYYLFKVKKGKQNFCDAYFDYGNWHHSVVLTKDDQLILKQKWLKSIGNKKPKNKNHWSGLSRTELINAVESEKNGGTYNLYKIFSGFTHPGAFTLERTLHQMGEIYKGYSEVNSVYPAYIVAQMFVFASEHKLYGIKTSLARKHITALKDFLAIDPQLQSNSPPT